MCTCVRGVFNDMLVCQRCFYDVHLCLGGVGQAEACVLVGSLLHLGRIARRSGRSDEAMLSIVLQEMSDADVNELVWKYPLRAHGRGRDTQTKMH